MRWCLCVCLLALFSLNEVNCAKRKNKNTYSLEDGEDHEPVRTTMDINNPDEEFAEGSGAINIEGSGSPPPITGGSGEQEIFHVDIKITAINGEEAKFKPDLLDNTSQFFKETENFVCQGVLIIVSNSEDMECRVIEFSSGSIIAKTELKISPSSRISSEQVETQIKRAAKQGVVGALSVDPKSIVLKNPYITVKMTTTDTPEGVVTEVETTTKMKFKPTTTNEFVFETVETTSQIVDVKPTEITDATFFDKLFQSPVMLAGMVGAAVLVLLTMILLTMFIVYRVKKKDEGSYSLDEPSKMKDPQAYWKDTKEFYA